jgi:hypothetical protein
MDHAGATCGSLLGHVWVTGLTNIGYSHMQQPRLFDIGLFGHGHTGVQMHVHMSIVRRLAYVMHIVPYALYVAC